MANICSNYITISGDSAQLEALSKRLKEQDPELLKILPNFTINNISDYCINSAEDIDDDGSEINFYFGSKYNCPLNGITELSSEYHELEFQLRFEEAANEYFGTAYICAGSCNEISMKEIDYLKQYNEEYIDQLLALESTPYEEFIKTYTHDNFFEEHPFGFIDRAVVKRIKDEDLALFINREWFDGKAHEEYKQRLTGGSTIEPETEE